MPNMSDIIQPNPNIEDDKPLTKVADTNADVSAAIRRATGLDLSVEDLKTFAEKKKEQEANKPSDGMRVLTPEEIAQFNGPEVKIDEAEEADRQRNEHADAIVRTKKDELADLIAEATKEEEARYDRHTEALEDEDTRKKLTETAVDKNAPVRYQAPIGDAPEMNNDDSAKDPLDSDPMYDVETTSRVEQKSAADEEDDLTPSYTDDEEEETTPDATPTNPNQRPDGDINSPEYSEYLKNLEIAKTSIDEKDAIIHVVREKSDISIISSNRNSGNKVLGDQAFMNAVTKYKKDNFRTVSVPLVNSGFFVDVVGTGAVDLSLLYGRVDDNMDKLAYEMEKMRTVFKNITGTTPKINTMNLKNMVHFTDYQMILYAHIAATLKDVESVHTCDECGRDFHIVCDSKDLLINMDKLKEKAQQIEGAAHPEDVSLMAKNKLMTTPSGFKINLGHPSYTEYLRYMTELNTINSQLSEIQMDRIRNMTPMLPFIRAVELPNKVKTNSLYQRFIALTLLSDDEFTEVTKLCTKMAEEILLPEFGIRKVECPHCHKMNTNIRYNDLSDLVFFHSTVTRVMKLTED